MAGHYRNDTENRATVAGIRAGTKQKKSTREIMYMLDRAKRNQEYRKQKDETAERLEYNRARNVKNANRKAYIRENGIDREDAALNRNDFDREVEYTTANNMKWLNDWRKAQQKKKVK